MLVKLNESTAVDTELVSHVLGESVGIERPRRITVVVLKDGTRLKIPSSPTSIMEKLGIK